MNRLPRNPARPVAERQATLLKSLLHRSEPCCVLAVSFSLLAMTACSPQPPAAGSGAVDSRPASSDSIRPQRGDTDRSAANETSANQTDKRRPGPPACQSSQLALSLDAGDGRFDGMSHSGTMLLLRNTATVACTLPAQPQLILTDAHKQTLNIVAQQTPAASTSTITLAANGSATSDMRWVSGDVYDGGHCDTPARMLLTLGAQTVATAFAGRLCGAKGQPSSYVLTAFKPAEASDPAPTAHSMTYACADGRRVKAIYPDRETATLSVDGRIVHLHVAVAADGVRYVGDHWQWWTKGIHQARLAPLKARDSIASTGGIECHAP